MYSCDLSDMTGASEIGAVPAAPDALTRLILRPTARLIVRTPDEHPCLDFPNHGLRNQTTA